MKTIIAGSRGITDYQILLDAIEQAESEGLMITEVVSGTCKDSPDILGERYAEEERLPLHRFPADWKRYKHRAGPLRNEQMAHHSEALLAIWDGYSNGTRHMIQFGIRVGLKVVVYRTDHCLF
jgi:hypothetical protein